MKLVRNCLFSLFLVFLFISFSPSAQADDLRLIDQAGLFSPEEAEVLTQTIANFREKTGLDAAVLTTNDAQGKTAEAYADDYFDEHQMGTGNDASGFLFLIDVGSRNYHISTSGKVIKLLTDQRINTLLDNAEDDMRNGNYSGAALSVLNDVLAYTDTYQYNETTNSFRRVKKITGINVLIASVAAVIAGIVSYSSVYGTYNLKRATYKYPYREKGDLKLRRKEDQLINTHTTSRRIPQSSSSGGGSSTHTSSGGSSHGGGGRSF